MPFQESQTRRKIDFRFTDSAYKSSLDYPNQFIKTDVAQTRIGIDEENWLVVDSSYANKILQALRLRKQEGDKDYQQLTSSRFKDWVSLTNCHRVMLFIFGFNIDELKDNDMGSKIIDDNFKEKSLLPVTSDSEISNRLLKEAETEKFPFALNFYMKGFDGSEEARHSVTVLGVIPNGKILCFHKDEYGEGKKTEITTLDRISEAHNPKYKYTLHSKDEVLAIIEQLRSFKKSHPKI